MNSFAKKLRKNSTDTGKLLWRPLRAKQISGLKFRRQESIGKYIVDFVCFEKRVIIECDGGQHMSQKDKDYQRDRWFIEQGFWRVMISYSERRMCWKKYLKGHPPLNPLPSREGKVLQSNFNC